MKTFVKAALLAATALWSTSCTRAAPDAGEEGVLISKPWFFGHGGVQSEPVKTGLSFVSWTTSVVYVNVMPQMVREHFDDLMSKDGVPLSFDAYVKLQVTDSVALVQKYSGGLADMSDEHHQNAQLPAWYAQNLQGPIRNIVRDAVKQYGMNEVAITYVANLEIEKQVQQGIEQVITRTGVPVRLVDFTLGKANPPDSVLNQRVQTAREQQRQITEQQTQLAEQARKGAETARAEADNAYRQSMGLSPEQFVHLQQIQMQRDVCLKNPCTFVAGNALPIINSK
ncbi:MAG: SPFH domain-containing protein [Alphaproteobacteria bacterium]